MAVMWNLKKISAACLVMGLLWLILFLKEEPKTEPVQEHRLFDLKVLQHRLDELQKQMDDQYDETNRLWKKVQKHVEAEIIENDSRNSDAKYAGKIAGPNKRTVLPVLVISCDRVTVSRCLDNLVKYRPDPATFPIIVSQDCGHNETYKVIKKYVDADPSMSVIQQPDTSEIRLPKPKVKFRGYYKIARHYKFALSHVFNVLKHDAVIIVEDDLDISPDFFEYFRGTYHLLQDDPSLWCISAWNDNGKEELIELARPELLHRSDFFPGLGWMLRRDVWAQLEPNWPPAFFDDWLRDPENTGGRACIRPEISRTYSFGKVGVSKGLFFDMHLKYIKLNTEFVEFTKLDLSYLMKEAYDKQLAQIYELEEVSAAAVMARGGGAAVRVAYADAKSYKRAASAVKAMDDFRSGIPRTAYRGVVSLFVRGRRVHLAPSFPWTGYDPTWT